MTFDFLDAAQDYSDALTAAVTSSSRLASNSVTRDFFVLGDSWKVDEQHEGAVPVIKQLGVWDAAPRYKKAEDSKVTFTGEVFIPVANGSASGQVDTDRKYKINFYADSEDTGVRFSDPFVSINGGAYAEEDDGTKWTTSEATGGSTSIETACNADTVGFDCIDGAGSSYASLVMDVAREGRIKFMTEISVPSGSAVFDSATPDSFDVNVYMTVRLQDGDDFTYVTGDNTGVGGGGDTGNHNDNDNFLQGHTYKQTITFRRYVVPQPDTLLSDAEGEGGTPASAKQLQLPGAPYLVSLLIGIVVLKRLLFNCQLSSIGDLWCRW